MVRIEIIHEEETFLVIAKPAGVVVNRAESVEDMTIQDWMENKLHIPHESLKKNETEEFLHRSGVVHRLDKETSGVLVLAKTVEAFQNLKNQFKDRKTEKHYVALVHGKLQPKSGTVNLPIKRGFPDRRKFTINVEGRTASTAYEVRQYLAQLQTGEVLTLVQLYPKTGRTHQLRVHMSHLGHPIVSDPLYLGKRLESDLTWCPRLFLHAQSLSFFHPETGERVEFEVLLPKDLNKSLEELENEIH